MEPRRTPEPEVAGLYREHHRRLTLLAYRILGQWQSAEDVASEALLKLLENDPEDPAAWLTVVVTRLALDAATSAERRRTEYVGPWLPDIVATESDSVEVDAAVVRLIQTLAPLDRALVVLADVAGFTGPEMAAALGLTPAAVRQRLSRARGALRAEGPVAVAEPDLVQKLAGLLQRGDLPGFVSELSEGAVLWTDSGGLSRAALNPVAGRDKVARFLHGIFHKYGAPSFGVRQGIGGPVLVAHSTDMERWVVLETDGERITGIQVQQNPSKRVCDPGSWTASSGDE
ncbi:sigma factor-like helix-turn-helix DNA-binding protein [Corynebacterium doosanense]|uniref:RNA polymerase subunit sigma-24 n=1 Tax=Corynebacterium doosanense CAU 212 = DSM 45436 TaxID=558173 RepID=A0A097IFH1_9CORY|nr:sigma factor-like helix-turn-helix DNA-binding protein [Corynebacterium doosanense]AIT60874.1 RNA polymerase subunit sigma-24 [Corynebacterium doosanense CAU 212 = DSM 45436]